MLRWLPLGVFGVPWASFGTTLDSLWLPLGCPWAPLRRPEALVGPVGSLWAPWAALGRPGTLVGPLVSGLGASGSLSGAFGLPLAVLCDLLGRPGVPVGSLRAPWTAFGHLLDLIKIGRANVQKSL